MMNKKNVFMCTILCALVISFTSCGKEDNKQVIKQSFQVDLDINESYVFILPQSIRDIPYKFINQADHFTISELGKNSGGQQIYQYTPLSNYMGVDRVVVSNDDDPQMQQCGPKGGMFGDCMGVKDSRYEITIDFLIGRGNLNASK